MRTIKFRAWDEDGEMEDVKAIRFNSNDLVVETKNGVTGILGSAIIALMQFTGLKDKNGKEIYEGDILRFVNRKGHKHDWEVFWSDKSAWQMRCFKGHEESHTPQSLYNKAEVHEVIGNIYENPELLKP